MNVRWRLCQSALNCTPKHTHLIGTESLKTGKTTVLTGEQARELLDIIDTSTLVGLRDRALISVMTFAFAHIGAVVAMRVEDYDKYGTERLRQ